MHATLQEELNFLDHPIKKKVHLVCFMNYLHATFDLEQQSMRCFAKNGNDKVFEFKADCDLSEIFKAREDTIFTSEYKNKILFTLATPSTFSIYTEEKFTTNAKTKKYQDALLDFSTKLFKRQIYGEY